MQANSSSESSHKCFRKVYIGIPLRAPVEGMPPFMMIPALVGPNNQYPNHIGNTTNTSVQLRGFGSGCTGQNSSQDPLHFAIGGSTEEQVAQAEALAQNLIASVRSKREQFYQGLRVHMYVPACSPMQVSTLVVTSAAGPCTPGTPPWVWSQHQRCS